MRVPILLCLAALAFSAAQLAQAQIPDSRSSPQAQSVSTEARITEIAAAFRDTRRQSLVPAEQVRLIEELYRLNPEALPKSFARAPAELRQGLAAACAAHRSAAAASGRLTEDFSATLLELRLQAGSPQESVRLTSEFLRLNQAAHAQILTTPRP